MYYKYVKLYFWYCITAFSMIYCKKLWVVRNGIFNNKLWKLLIDKNMNKVALRGAVGITPSTLSKLSKNQKVSMDVLEKICKGLGCNIGDIVDYVD